MLLTYSHKVRAKWEAIKYPVKFNANGGNVSSASKLVSYETKFGTLPTPTRANYKFAGWYTAKSGGTAVNANAVLKTVGGATIYAHWLKQYTVKFDANKGKVSKKSKIVTGTEKYSTLPTPTRAGYKFDGWFTKKSGGTKITASTKVAITKTTTLYAHWTVKKYTAKFNVNGGNKLAASKLKKTVTFDKKYGKLVTPSKKGYKFAGWYTKKVGGSKITSTSKVKITKTTTYYAHWTRK
jgi:uncharacterized repeat protein (TIGR02543 family)